MNSEKPAKITLMDALQGLYPQSSKTTLRSWMKEDRIKCNGRIERTGDVVVGAHAKIELLPKKKFIARFLPIVYEDKSFIVIDKPAGLLSVSTDSETERTAFSLLKKHFHPKPVYVVHRLDQDTSGVMLFALSKKAMEKLKVLFEKHDIVRRYGAIVEGIPEQDSGTWKSYLWEDARYRMHSSNDPQQGELAITHFSVKKRGKRYSWLDIQLETGKKNQIRVHCKDAGFPVLGDGKYGKEKGVAGRLCLHAYYLEFLHPETGKKMKFESGIPAVFPWAVNLQH